MTSEVNIPNPCEDCLYYTPGKGYKHDCSCSMREPNGHCTCQFILPDNMGDGYE